MWIREAKNKANSGASIRRKHWAEGWAIKKIDGAWINESPEVKGPNCNGSEALIRIEDAFADDWEVVEPEQKIGVGDVKVIFCGIFDAYAHKYMDLDHLPEGKYNITATKMEDEG